jgi:hypothetical protein
VPNYPIGETFTISPIGGEKRIAKFHFTKLSIGHNSNDIKSLGKIRKIYLTVSVELWQKRKTKEYLLRLPIT